MVSNFHQKRFAGSLQWRAPEYVQGQKYYFKKPPNYWCNDCMSRNSDRGFNIGGGYTAGRSSARSSGTTNQTSRTQGVDLGVHTNFSFKCINCKEKVIFDYYKKADIYAVGLARFSNIANLHTDSFAWVDRYYISMIFQNHNKSLGVFSKQFTNVYLEILQPLFKMLSMVGHTAIFLIRHPLQLGSIKCPFPRWKIVELNCILSRVKNFQTNHFRK